MPKNELGRAQFDPESAASRHTPPPPQSGPGGRLHKGDALSGRLLDAVEQAVIATDLDGTITYWNRSAELLYAWASTEVLGRNVFDVVTIAATREQAIQIIERLRQGETWSGEFPVRSRDGRLRTVAFTHQPLYDEDGALVGMVGVSTDVSQRVRLEDDLRQRVQQLAEADRRKDEFLAMLAHELRNPLAPIRNALQIVRQVGTSGPVAERALEVVERQVKNLAHLVDDLLDVSRITGGKINLQKERVRVKEAIQRVAEMYGPAMAARGLHFSVSVPSRPLYLEVDPTRLEQILSNLLSNAAKYTDPGGSVELSAGRRGRDIVFRVRDTGMGIPPHMLPHIFELFRQGDQSLDRTHGGLGIGLTLVRKLVEMHGGAVRARSAGLGKGSEFLVRLPHRDGGPGPAVVAPAVGKRISRLLKVLVVDDNHDAARSLATLLRLWGHDVRVAYDGPAALEAAQSEHFEMIFLDIGLPGMDGYQVAEQLRRDNKLNDCVLVALTGYGQEEARSRSRNAGFDRHLTKPVDPAELQSLLADPERARLQAGSAASRQS
jgi:two-component system CheB/CheR fusion protein